jgi:23S rRNA pseudouridine2605 synthase
MAQERLQKILARGGLASRRAAERLIAEGQVRVNGRVVTELGTKADPYKDKVEVNGQRIVAERAVYVVLHKPRGVVTTMSDPEGRPSIREILEPIGSRVYPVGRLDFATSGVLLATNDGDFAEGLMHPKKAVPKTYVVKVAGMMQPKDLDRWREGIRLEDGVTLPAKLNFLRHEGEKTWFELTIREGRNQQIRRMGEATGFPVMRLARLSFAGISAEGLRPGEWRYLEPNELVDLKQDYGVPKRIVDVAARSAAGRGKRPTTRVHAAPAPSRSREGGTDGPRGRGGDGPRSRGADGPRSRGTDGPRSRGPASGGKSTEQPRYGGGSPGRRGYDVAEDWGGGAGRGRTGRDRGSDDRSAPQRGSSSGRGARSDAPRGDAGGRGGQSRTTGTGGGIGAGGGDYRIKGRSGARSR